MIGWINISPLMERDEYNTLRTLLTKALGELISARDGYLRTIQFCNCPFTVEFAKNRVAIINGDIADMEHQLSELTTES